MKILKEGRVTDRSTWTKNVTCRKCIAELRVVLTDVKHQAAHHDMRPGESTSGYDYIVCPECGCHTRVTLPRFRAGVAG